MRTMKMNNEKIDLKLNPNTLYKKRQPQEVKKQEQEVCKQKCKQIFIVIKHENVNKAMEQNCTSN